MKNLIRKIKKGEDIQSVIDYVMYDLYTNGAKKISTMEILCYLSIYQPDKFKKISNQILKYMGVNYKSLNTDYFTELIFDMYENYIETIYNNKYTPVQANIINEVEKNKCFSFSAPTSTGKSYVLRNLIINAEKDVVIVVPSRALINEYYINLCNLIKNKDVNILTFIDKINTKKAIRNVFIVTPERCKELFKHKEQFDVEIFLFDEAQLSNEESFRGIFFDSIVRRAQKAYPEAKYIFSHPFVENPYSQIIKNHFDVSASLSKCYKYRNVGQMFYVVDDNKYFHFGIDKSIMGNQKEICEFDPIEKTLEEGGSILIYTTKTSIYKKTIFSNFSEYINLCKQIENEEAKKYIEQIKQYIGANDTIGTDRYSEMINMLKRGIVIHHGSLPLQARLLLEKFTNSGYCKLCFATSTLEQGINMPFDIVYLNTFKASKPLSLKNLIGRAGRSTLEKKFDYGSIIVKANNMSSLRKIIEAPDELEKISMLEQEVDDDLQEFQEAIIEGTFSDEYNITEKQLKKLKDRKSESIIIRILNTMFKDGDLISISTINADMDNKLELYELFADLYEYYLGRELCQGEKNVLNTAIKILLWKIHCKSFKDICFYRYAYASKKQERDELKKMISSGDSTTKKIASMKLNSLKASFFTQYSDIPDKKLQVFSMYGEDTNAVDVDYDRIVFDTYDYIDKMLGFKLNDIFFASFNEYYKKSKNIMAKKMAQLIKYGTNDDIEIWMLRYGFTFEDIEWLKPYVNNINQEEIVFNSEVENLSIDKISIINRFL